MAHLLLLKTWHCSRAVFMSWSRLLSCSVMSLPYTQLSSCVAMIPGLSIRDLVHPHLKYTLKHFNPNGM